jgi:hypothetical protein
MIDPHMPSAIIAQTLQRTFPSGGDWENWKPLADHILTRLMEAGFGVVPMRLQDRRLSGQIGEWSQPDSVTLPFAPTATRGTPPISPIGKDIGAH